MLLMCLNAENNSKACALESFTLNCSDSIGNKMGFIICMSLKLTWSNKLLWSMLPHLSHEWTRKNNDDISLGGSEGKEENIVWWERYFRSQCYQNLLYPLLTHKFLYGSLKFLRWKFIWFFLQLIEIDQNTTITFKTMKYWAAQQVHNTYMHAWVGRQMASCVLVLIAGLLRVKMAYINVPISCFLPYKVSCVVICLTNLQTSQ